MKPLPPSCAIAVIAALAAGAAAAPDLSLSPKDVLYDTTSGRLEVVVGLTHGAVLTPFTVVATNAAGMLKAEHTVEKAEPGRLCCRLEWPRAPLGSKITITVRSEREAKEEDQANNTVTVTMEDALNRDFEQFETMMERATGAADERLPSSVYEAEDFPVKAHVRVEEAAGASGGKAVRLIGRGSRIERDVSLEAGVYLFYTVSMAVAGDQDALKISLGRARKRSFFHPHHKWVAQREYGIARLEKGSYKLAVYYDEPNVLVDKVVVVKCK